MGDSLSAAAGSNAALIAFIERVRFWGCALGVAEGAIALDSSIPLRQRAIAEGVEVQNCLLPDAKVDGPGTKQRRLGTALIALTGAHPRSGAAASASLQPAARSVARRLHEQGSPLHLAAAFAR